MYLYIPCLYLSTWLHAQYVTVYSVDYFTALMYTRDRSSAKISSRHSRQESEWIIRTNNKNSITLSNAPPAWCWWWCKKSQRQQRNNGTSRRNVVCSVAVHCWYLLFGIDARKGHGSAPFTAPRKTRTNMMLVIIGMELLLRRWIIIGSPIMTSSNIRISITKNPLLQYYEYCTRARIVLRMWIHRVKPPLNYPFHSQYIYNAIHPTPSSPASITLPRPIYLIRG